MPKTNPASRTAALNRGRGRPKAKSDDEQRGLIVEAARELFVSRGYGHTTMADVAAHCHMSKRTLYELFSGKAALFAAIVEAHRFEMLALPGDYDDLPLTEALAQIFRIDLDDEASESRIAIMQFIMMETRQHPELGPVMRRHGPDTAIGLLAKWLNRERRRSRVSVDDTNAAAKMLMDMVFGAMAAKTADGLEWPGAEDRTTYVRRCIDVFVNGVGTTISRRRKKPR